MLSIIEVCQLTGKSEKTIYRMMNSGSLPFTQQDGKRLIKKKDALSLLPHSNVKEIEKRDNLEQKVVTLTNEVIRLSGLIEILIEGQETPISNLSQLEGQKDKGITQNSSSGKRQKLSSNEIRAQKAKNQLFDALDTLSAKNQIPLYRGAPSVTGIHRITGIDRGTISKYLQEWIKINS